MWYPPFQKPEKVQLHVIFIDHYKEYKAPTLVCVVLVLTLELVSRHFHFKKMSLVSGPKGWEEHSGAGAGLPDAIGYGRGYCKKFTSD